MKSESNLLPVGVFLVFLTLKLLGKINWPWVWVASPLWIPAGLALVIVLVVLAVGVIKAVRS